jgi:hypothetical protein
MASIPERCCYKCRNWTVSPNKAKYGECEVERPTFAQLGWPSPTRRGVDHCAMYERQPTVAEAARALS